MKRSSIVAAVAALLTCAGAAQASFTITLNFTGGLTASQQAVFTTAANTWQSYVTGYQPGISITGITMNASGTAIDGPNGVLGSAGPTGSVNQGGFSLTTTGSMQFDTADLPGMEGSGSLLYVILHEMGHIMGIGTQWISNNVYVNNSGHYTGAFGVAAYAAEFGQPGATFIPVELGGGGGTANGHWNEFDGGGSATGIVSVQGDMQSELMTGWLNNPSYISNMTVQSFRDIGFTVVPTPGAAAMLGLGGLMATRRRR